MKVSFFIDRPVFSIVVSMLIVIVGFIGLTMLPIDQYPQITPPVVKISASYPGASAVTVAQAVATPIEQQLNGTPGMLYMESTSSNSGGFSATVTFDIDTDPELAAVDIQNRIKLAESRLPAEVVQNGINVERQSPSQLMTICLTSSDPKFDEIYLSNFATLNVLDLIRRIPGVGRVSNIGSRYYAMQIWVQPDKLASYGLTIADLQKSLKDQNRESAAGEFGKAPVVGVDITTPITTQGRLSTVGQFEEIVLRANPDGSLIRLRDVARISLLWNLIALVGVAIVDVVIASFDKKVKGMDEKLAASQAAILDCTTEAMNIVAENPSSELKKDLEELVEMLKYSDNSCTTGDEAEIHTKLRALRATVKDDDEAAKTEIDAIRTLIGCRNNNIKNKKRGSF